MRFGIVIVNYNGADLALNAALSALGDDPTAKIVIVDNASTDQSLEVFKKFASGDWHRVDTSVSVGDNDSDLIGAPLRFANERSVSVEVLGPDERLGRTAISIIANNRNDGFAAGSNLGLRALRTDFDPDAYLLLNPDTLLAQGSLEAFRVRLRDKSVGLCGGSVLRIGSEVKVQAFGGAKLRPHTLLGVNIGEGLALRDRPERGSVEAEIAYPLGAAMACRRDFVETVGMMEEQYFLYYEEADWAMRSVGLYKTAWAPEAVIYHYHGAAAGSRLGNAGRSPLADFHMVRSRLIFARKWNLGSVPFLRVMGILQAARRVLRGRPRNALSILRASFSI